MSAAPAGKPSATAQLWCGTCGCPPGRSPTSAGSAPRPSRRAPPSRSTSACTQARSPTGATTAGKPSAAAQPSCFTCASTSASSSDERASRRGAALARNLNSRRARTAGLGTGASLKRQGAYGQNLGLLGDSTSFRDAEGGSSGQPAKLPEALAALRSPLRAVSGQLNPGGALILEAGTAHVALLSGLRGPQVLGREARLHTPTWLPSLPAPLLCNWGLPAPTYFFTHTVLSACSSPTPRPAWELPFPRDPLRPSASLAFSPP